MHARHAAGCGSVLLLAMGLGNAACAEDATGYTGSYVRASMDTVDCIHLVFTPGGWASSYYGRFDGTSWGSPTTLPGSLPCFAPYTVPTVEVGPSLMAQAAYGTETGYYPNDLAYFTLATATNASGTSWTTQDIGNDGNRRSDYALAIDDGGAPHLAYMMTSGFWPYWWRIIYRRPDGTEVVIRNTTSETYHVMAPAIAYGDGIVRIAWREGGIAFNTVNLFYAEGPPEGPFPVQQLTSVGTGFFVSGTPDLAVAPDHHVEIAYLLKDGTSSPSRYVGVYALDPAGVTTLVDSLDAEATDAWAPRIAFDAAGNRYVAWSLEASDSSYYAINSDTVIALPGVGSIDVCARSLAYYVRETSSGIVCGEIPAAGEMPTATITFIEPNPLRRGIDPGLTLLGTAFDNDESGESAVMWEWMSSIDGLLGDDEDLTLPAIALSPGMHIITFRCMDDEGVWAIPDIDTLQVMADTIPPPPVTALSVAAGMGDSLVVSWSTVTDNLGMRCYRVFRGFTSWFIPDIPVDSVMTQEPSLYIDPDGMSIGTGLAFYEVVPVDVDGNAAEANVRAGAVCFFADVPVMGRR